MQAVGHRGSPLPLYGPLLSVRKPVPTPRFMGLDYADTANGSRNRWDFPPGAGRLAVGAAVFRGLFEARHHARAVVIKSGDRVQQLSRDGELFVEIEDLGAWIGEQRAPQRHEVFRPLARQLGDAVARLAHGGVAGLRN